MHLHNESTPKFSKYVLFPCTLNFNPLQSRKWPYASLDLAFKAWACTTGALKKFDNAELVMKTASPSSRSSHFPVFTCGNFLDSTSSFRFTLVALLTLQAPAVQTQCTYLQHARNIHLDSLVIKVALYLVQGGYDACRPQASTKWINANSLQVLVVLDHAGDRSQRCKRGFSLILDDYTQSFFGLVSLQKDGHCIKTKLCQG